MFHLKRAFDLYKMNSHRCRCFNPPLSKGVWGGSLNVSQHIFRAQTFAQTFALYGESKLFAGGFFYANICITGTLKSDGFLFLSCIFSKDKSDHKNLKLTK